MGEMGVLKPLLIGIGASAAANQIPQNQRPSKLGEVIHEHEKKKKGKVKKAYEDYVQSTDPDFNHAAARKAFNLVMKMDDETAQMFTHIVVSDLFEETIEKNMRTLQRHLDEVIAKQIGDWRLASGRLVAKGYDQKEMTAYTNAVDQIDEIVKASHLNPYDYGYQFKEEDFRRDASTGRFRTKIVHRQTAELPEKMSEQILGVKTPKKTADGRKLSPEDKVRFQDEYRQLASFLSSVNQSSGQKGNQTVMLHYRDKSDGTTWSELHFGKTPPLDRLADPNFELLGAEAKPEALTAGGAAFGLATALGGTMSPRQVHGINNLDQDGAGASKFANDWLNSGDQSGKASNQKLYDRMAHSGSFLSDTAPPGSKAALAGRFAQIVGNHGPEAEAVLGPSARKTAYRYRGTEKAPEKQLVKAYGDAVLAGKTYGLEPEEEELLRRGPGRGLSHGSLVAAGSRTRRSTPRDKGGADVPLHRAAAERQDIADRAPTWSERDLGRQTVVAFLTQKTRAPKKGLYGLQLAAGNTPPSEGVIINADGQIASQAVGYGDDHYLPFNLKNLKSLKGGEYIRTRSVGGLTSEDIYTGLISGARQVTVTSRSGTYTMTFEPDFRGGRRYNDKARRMTRRYEQLLDAVQSQQVERGDIDPEMRQQIEAEVKEEMSGPQWRRADIQETIKDRIDEFKENPYISEQDEKRADAIVNSRAAGANEKERAKIRAEVYDDLLDQKETRFRLNSEGYKAALDSLAEQFPYYIKSRYTPPKDVDRRIETERDKGYVEPGRNRPTAATAGLYGTVKGKSGKFSAASADYQAVRAVARGGSAGVGTAHLDAGDEKDGDGVASPTSGNQKDELHRKRRAAAANAKMEESVVTTAQELQRHAKATLDENSKKDPEVAAALGMTEADLRDPRNQKRFADWAEAYTNLPGFKDLSMKRRWEAAIGNRERKPWVKGNTAYPKQPPTFPGEDAYLPGADYREVAREIHKVDRKAKGSVVSGALTYSQMSDKEWQDEHRALAQMFRSLSDDPTPLDKADLDTIGVDPSSPALSRGKRDLRRNKDDILEQMELLQRSRALVSQLSDKDRNKLIEESSKVTITHETPTSEEQVKPKQNVKAQVAWGKNVLGELESLRARANAKLGEQGLNDAHREAIVRALEKLPDEDQTERAQNAVAIWDTHQDDLRTTDEFNEFNETMQEDVDALMDASGILKREKDHIEILLNPPKAQGILRKKD